MYYIYTSFCNYFSHTIVIFVTQIEHLNNSSKWYIFVLVKNNTFFSICSTLTKFKKGVYFGKEDIWQDKKRLIINNINNLQLFLNEFKFILLNILPNMLIPHFNFINNVNSSENHNMCVLNSITTNHICFDKKSKFF